MMHDPPITPISHTSDGSRTSITSGPSDGRQHGERSHDRCGCRRISSCAAREHQPGPVQG